MELELLLWLWLDMGSTECKSEWAEQKRIATIITTKSWSLDQNRTTTTTTALVANSLCITPEWSRCGSQWSGAGLGMAGQCRWGPGDRLPASSAQRPGKLARAEAPVLAVSWKMYFIYMLYVYMLIGEGSSSSCCVAARLSKWKQETVSVQPKSKANLTMHIIKIGLRFCPIQSVSCFSPQKQAILRFEWFVNDATQLHIWYALFSAHGLQQEAWIMFELCN